MNQPGAIIAREQGSVSPPLVLLHGFPLDSRIFEPQLTALSNHRRIVAPDLRGFGKANSDEPFTIESLADDVHELLSSRGLLPCVLAGLSMGGYVALAFAKRYPADLVGLVLISTRAEGDNEIARKNRNKMIDLAREENGAKKVADEILPKLIFRQDTIAKDVREIIESQNPKTIANACAAMRDRPDRTADLPSITVPTLIVAGENDALIPPQSSRTMASAIPHAELTIIPACGHLPSLEQPDSLNAALRSFVDRL